MGAGNFQGLKLSHLETFQGVKREGVGFVVKHVQCQGGGHPHREVNVILCHPTYALVKILAPQTCAPSPFPSSPRARGGAYLANLPSHYTLRICYQE